MEKEKDCQYTCMCLCAFLSVITLLSCCLCALDWCKKPYVAFVIFLIANIFCICISMVICYKNTRILSKTTEIVSDLKKITDNYTEISRHAAKCSYNYSAIIKDNKDDLYKTIEVITRSLSDKSYDESKSRMLKELITEIINSHKEIHRATPKCEHDK